MKTRFEWEVERNDQGKITNRYATIYVIGSKSETEDDVFKYAKTIVDYFEAESWFEPVIDFYDEDENSVMILFGSVEPSDRMEIKEYLAEYKADRKEKLAKVSNDEVVVEATEGNEVAETNNDQDNQAVSQIDLKNATAETLQKYANELTLKYWNCELDIPIVLNGRLSVKLGRFILIDKKAHSIELSKNLLRFYPDGEIHDVLLHELCHWYCHKQGLDYRDKSPDFEKEIERVGSHTSGTLKYKGKIYKLICSKCGRTLSKGRTKTVVSKYKAIMPIAKCCYEETIIIETVR